MIRIFLPLICAALGFAAASCSQSESPLASAEAPSSPQSTAHGAAAAAMPTSPDGTDASQRQEQTQAQDVPQPSPDQAPPSAVPPNETPTSTEPKSADAPAIAAQSAAQAEPATGAPASTPLERRASTLIGIPVVSTDGSPLGAVKDIIFDRQGRATHLVIAYASQPDAAPGDTPGDSKPASSADDKLTAMPWDAAVASMKDGHLVLDVSKLQDAPSFTPDAWPDLDDPAWSAGTDTYWRKAVRAAIAAHPGAPIDSTDRQRGRRASRGDAPP